MLPSKALRSDIVKAPAASSRESVHVIAPNGNQYVSDGDYLNALTSWTFACVKARAEAQAEIGYKVFRQTNGTGQDAKKELPLQHWAAKLLLNPDGELDIATLRYLASMYMDANGNGYWWTPTYGGNVPKEIYVLPASRMQLITGKGKGDPAVLGYMLHTSTGIYPFPAREICHFRHPFPWADPFKVYYVGRSLIEAAWQAVKVDQAAIKYLANYFDNGALPAFGIRSPQTMDPEQFRQWLGHFNETFQGSSNAGKWIMLDGDKSIEPIQSGGRELELGVIDERNRDRICAVLGVPEPYLTQKHQNRASSVTVQAEFYSNANRHARLMCSQLTRHLNKFEVGLVVEPIERRVPDPDQDRADRESWIRSGVPVNYFLEREGMDPIAGGDVPIIEAGWATLDSIINPPAPPPPPNPRPTALEAPEEAGTEEGVSREGEGPKDPATVTEHATTDESEPTAETD